MGNVRLSFYKNSADAATILDESNYYPFGLEHLGYNAMAGNPSYRYQYNGKELQDDNGMYDYGARMYMPELGRWGVVDPLAEIYRRHTPYNYAVNNPIRFTDPDGMAVRDVNGDGTHMEYTGQEAIDMFNSIRDSMPISNSSPESPIISSLQSSGAGGGGGGSEPFKLIIGGSNSESAFTQLKELMKGQLNLTMKNGVVDGEAVAGAKLSLMAEYILDAIKSQTVSIYLDTVGGLYFFDTKSNGIAYFEGDAFRGSVERNGVIHATQIVSPDVGEAIDFLSMSPKGTTVGHAILEALRGALCYPGSGPATNGTFNIPYLDAHNWAKSIDQS